MFHLMLIYYLVFDGKNQVDYTRDFLHAEIECEDSENGIYVSMPMGFGQQEKDLYFNKSLYS